MPATYDSIATTTLGNGQTAVTFSGISAAYTDLRIVLNGGVASSASNVYTWFNGNTGNNYSYTAVTGDGATATSQRGTVIGSLLSNYYGYLTADMNTTITLDIMNYANSTTFKTVLIRSNNVGNGVAALAGCWNFTPQPITSVSVGVSVSTFAPGSTVTLYGIKAA